MTEREKWNMNIVVCGYGRAGKALIETILKSEDNSLCCVVCRNESSACGKDIGQVIYSENNIIGIPVISLADAYSYLCEKKVDVVIDFSNRVMAVSLLELCINLKCNLVVCTTNHSTEEIQWFEKAAEKNSFGVVYAPNLTIGINLLLEFTRKLAAVYEDARFEIIEKHPENKPIPTATSQIISQVTGRECVPIHSVRLNGYVSVHELIVTNGTERVILSHEAISREAFAKGALSAARFILGKQGLYFMKDVVEAL